MAGFLLTGNFCSFTTCHKLHVELLDMEGRLSCDNSSTVHGHSFLADKTTVLFICMVLHPRVSLCWRHDVWCGTSFALDLAQRRT